MNLSEFMQSVEMQTEPPADLSPALKALWYDGKGDWKRAHLTAQDVHDHDGSWVHAYLHRKEGDAGNARYWYSRAGRAESTDDLDQEWGSIVRELLNR